jgi:hypothetical protein
MGASGVYIEPSCAAAAAVVCDYAEEGVHGGLGRRFRRKVPLFQVRSCSFGLSDCQ